MYVIELRPNSHYQTGSKNLPDTVLEGVDETAARQLSGRWQKIDEIPFDFERRRMSVVVAEDSNVHQLVRSARYRRSLNVCTQVRHNGDIQPLDDNSAAPVKRALPTR